MATEENAIQAVALVGFADRGGVQGEVRWPLKVRGEGPIGGVHPIDKPGAVNGFRTFQQMIHDRTLSIRV